MDSVDRELTECAKINFENFEKAVPSVKTHPFYMIAKAQLDEALGYSTVEESLKQNTNKEKEL